MSEMKRRAFMKSSALCATGAVATSQTAEARSNASGVGGYDYPLPKIKQGATLI